MSSIPPEPPGLGPAVTESALEAARDGADLAGEIQGGADPAKLASIADRLSEEYAEIAGMLRALLPGAGPPAV
jgi:hypothetical protein